MEHPVRVPVVAYQRVTVVRHRLVRQRLRLAPPEEPPATDIANCGTLPQWPMEPQKLRLVPKADHPRASLHQDRWKAMKSLTFALAHLSTKLAGRAHTQQLQAANPALEVEALEAEAPVTAVVRTGDFFSHLSLVSARLIFYLSAITCA